MAGEISVRRCIPRAVSRLCILVLLGTALTAGCNKAPPPNSDGVAAEGDAAAAPTSARAVLDRMVEAYREATSYADSGHLVFSYVLEDGQRIKEDANFSVTFEHPNKLRMHVYLANIVCDGHDLRGFADIVPEQVLSVPAPRKLTQETLYTDPVLSPQLTQGIIGASLQFALLVADNPLSELLDGTDPPALLEPAEVDGEPCYRIQLNPNFGKVVFSIDKKSYVVRRIDFPESAGRNALRELGDTVTNISLVAEFKGARLNEAVDQKAFQFSAPDGAKLVDQLIVQPKFLGKRAPEFEFRPLAGPTMTRGSLAGKIAIIYCWESSAEPSLMGLPNLEQVYQKYKDNDKVAFLAVSIDGDKTTDDQLRDALAKAKCTVPILRDPQQHAQTALEIGRLPSLFVVGPDGTVQYVETEYNADLATQLPPLLDKLLAGQSVYEEAMRENERRQRKLSGSPAGSPDTAASTVTEIPRADIAVRSQPDRLKLSPLWTYSELKQSGNILVVERDAATPRLFVCDGKRTIVELDSAGKLVARHELDIPLTAVVAYLRTVVSRQGQRYFAGCAAAQQQLHLFDADFKRLMSYPAEGQHAGIYDVQLADLDGDGQPELNVGYLGVVGVQNAALDGVRRWSNRSVEDVRSLAVSGPAESEPAAGGARHLLAAAAGSITPIDDRGKNGPPTSIDGRFVRSIAAAELRGDGRKQYCCIAVIRAGMETAIGLSSDVREKWRYELPLGAQPNPALEMIAAGRVSGQHGQWLLAGADGSIHILADDGALVDRFNYGAAISGMAVAQFDAQPTLLIATAGGVDAWRVEAPATPDGSGAR